MKPNSSHGHTPYASTQMTEHYWTNNRFIKWFLIFSMSFGLSACGAIYTLRATSQKYDVSDPEKVTSELLDQKEIQELANKFGLMALFSKVVYRDDLPEKERTKNGCNYLSQLNEPPKTIPNYGMPKDDPYDISDDKIFRWQRWDKIINEGGPPCMDSGGLYYETYIHLDWEGKVDKAVIAFRGTENYRGQLVLDWTTNLTAAFGFEPSEYALARKAMRKLIEALKQSFNQVEIYATGHSLGGGLAQQLGYMSADVSEVITFNTTPVTNWTTLRLKSDIKKDYPTIYRIQHVGEFLSTPRFIATEFSKARYNRYDIGLQLQEKSPFKGHQIAIFACEFAKVIGQNQTAYANHYYPKDYAEYIASQKLQESNSDDKKVCEPNQ